MFKKYFLTGLKAFIPVVVTFAVVIWIFSNIEAFFGQIIQYVIPEQYYFDGLGILIGILFVFILGIVLNAWIIKQLYQLADAVVKKIPFIKTIYKSIQDLVSFFEKAQDTSHSKAVILEYGKTKCIGFVTREDFKGLPDGLGGDKDVLVYLPMSYMVGGMMIAVPRKRIKPFDMKVNEAMSLIITAGMTGGKDLTSSPP